MGESRKSEKQGNPKKIEKQERKKCEKVGNKKSRK